MKIFRSLEEVPADFRPSALTIGNFDGVHFGHRKILRRLGTIAAERNWKSSVLTFDPHPTCVVAPDRTPPLLTSPEQRAELMREEGIEQVLILPFNAELALLSPEEFVRRSLWAPFRSTKKGGWGIGLYQAKGIVEAHGGTIDVASREGTGTTFSITLPIGDRT